MKTAVSNYDATRMYIDSLTPHGRESRSVNIEFLEEQALVHRVGKYLFTLMGVKALG